MGGRRRAVGFRRTLLASGGCAVVLLAGSPAFAQDASRDGSANASDTQQTEDIVVTAQVRSERAQDVPVSLQVIGSKSLTEQNLRTLADVADYAPSVHVNNGIATNDLYIRGIGSGNNPAFDQGVGTFIDGIYHGRSRSSSADFFDLDRVEILKGPQSTFFGNNAIAGAFNLATVAPGESFGGYGRLLYGTHKNRLAEVAADIPLASGLSARVAVHYDGTRGWLHNITTGDDSPRNDNWAGRIILRYHPNSDLDIKLKAQKGINESKGGTLQLNDCPPPAPFAAAGFCALNLSLGLDDTVGLDKNTVARNAENIRLKTSEYVASASYMLGGHQVSLIAGYLNYDFVQNIDADSTPSLLLPLSTPEHYHQYSGELRVTSPTDKPVEYLFGIYAQDDRLRSTNLKALGFLTPVFAGGPLAALVAAGPLAQDLTFTQSEQSYAGFGSITWHITDAFSVTGGLRYTKVRKHSISVDQFGNQLTPYGPIVPFPGTLNDLPTPATGLQGIASALGLGQAGIIDRKATYDAFLPSAKLQYRLSDDAMLYASYARGFLAGGFNGSDISGNPANVPYTPEHVNAYEVGLKSELFDRVLLFNVDVFLSNYDNLQVQQFADGGGGTVISVVRNAASSRTKGVELETRWRVTPAFNVGANVTYMKAYYLDYKNVGLTQLQTFCHANVGNSACVAEFGGNGDPGALQDLSGRPTSYAPRLSGNINASYRFSFGSWDLTPSASLLFTSKYFPGGPGNDDPQLIQKGYTRLDARLSLVQSGGGLAIDVIGKNLTNRTIITSITNWPNAPGSFLAAKEEPRNVALQVRYEF